MHFRIVERFGGNLTALGETRMLRPPEKPAGKTGGAFVRENCVKSVRTKNARSAGGGTS
jgi:hypothetical protein